MSRTFSEGTAWPNGFATASSRWWWRCKWRFAVQMAVVGVHGGCSDCSVKALQSRAYQLKARLHRSVALEEGFSDEAVKDLEKRGHKVHNLHANFHDVLPMLC